MSARLWGAPEAVSEEAAPGVVPVVLRVAGDRRVVGVPAVVGGPEARDRAMAVEVQGPRSPEVSRNLAATTHSLSELSGMASWLRCQRC